MGEQGKCKEFGCNTPTKAMKNGGFFDYCWEHRPQPKPKEELPARSAQEQIADICQTYKQCTDWVQATYPKIDATMGMQIGMQIAMHLNNLYWKNDRTPR